MPEYLTYLAQVIGGLVLLVWGGDRFVYGASAVARNLGVTPLIIGLTGFFFHFKSHKTDAISVLFFFLFTGIFVIDDTIEVTIAIPAEGPSFGVAPSGT